MPEARDQDALQLLRKREPRGFELAYERYADRIFGFLLRLSRSRALAEDLFQHTFLRLAEGGAGLAHDSDLRAWLFSVARNAFYGHARARRTAERAVLVVPEASDGLVEAGLVLDELERALARLTASDRELLLLVGVEGLSYEEAALVLDLDQVSLRKRVSRARARLGVLLEPRSAPEEKADG
jgi:RNA polymerase sigma-70 factor (ECF subfamily)